MGNEVKISVIIPVYNVEKYLKECLNSVLNQTLKEIEIICVDDGSSDNSLKILEEYQKKDDRIKLLKQDHKGASCARNYGLSVAKGKYIQFLDSDDFFEKDFLELMYKHTEKFSTEITICSSRKIDADGKIIETNSPNFPINIDKIPMGKVFNRKDFSENIFSFLVPVVWNKLFLKSFLEKNNLAFAELSIYEDITFSHSAIALADRIVAFNKELINYRFNRVGSLISVRAKNTIEVVKACLKLKEFLKEKNLFNELKTSYKEVMLNNIRAEISYCNNEEYENFLKEFKKLLPTEWKKYKQALKINHITLEYLKKIVGNKKVMLWGGSLFIKQILEKEKNKNPNILGVIDRNHALEGKNFANYKIFKPEAIKELKPDGVLLTVLSNNETIYKSLKEEFKVKYPNVELLPNIFDEELEFCKI